MVPDESASRLGKKHDLIHLAILSALALGIGVYLIATTVLISKDGISYINYAKGLGIAPLKVMRDSSGYAPRAYTPGYPFLILMAHRLVQLVFGGSSELSWIYSAQAIALLCRILALIPLYFIGKEFVGSKLSFWAILILVMLPYPTKIGADVLRAWPHILFLATGFLFLLRAAKNGKWLMFALVGVVAGLGYVVRPVCAQLVVYGVMWLIYSIFRYKPECSMSRAKLIGGLALLIIGFAVVAAPYMKIRREILPQRLQEIMKSFSLNSEQNKFRQQENFTPVNSEYTAGLLAGKDNITEAFAMLIRRINEHLMYYFVPALFLGLYYYFRRKPKSESTFFIAAFILLNIAVLILRYCCAGAALSRRYALPLIAFTIFFVPAGLQIISRWVEGVLSRGVHRNGVSEGKLQRWFFVLLIIGLAICMPKLLRPIRIEKKGYRLAAEWLKENTASRDIIVVPDERISFYAERKGVRKLGKSVKYVVKRLKDQEKTPAEMTEVWSSYLNEKKKKYKVVIYQRI